jgi:hypothetical protein
MTHCTYVVRSKKTFEPRCCRNHAVKDGLCETHHPDAIQRRMTKTLQYWNSKIRMKEWNNEQSN